MARDFRGALFLLLFFVCLSPRVLAGPEPERARFRQAEHGVYVIAHRGAHDGIPENSLPAYAKAIELGCDFLEIDVRATKDGHFVSIHNPKIDSYTAGDTGRVSDMTLAQLKALDIGSRVGPQWKNTRIPTLEEILALARGKIGIYLDLKVPAVPELMKIIKSYGMEKDVVWYMPSYFYEKSGERAFENTHPMPDPGSLENLDTILDSHPVHVVATDMGVLSAEFVSAAHSRQAKVFVDDHEGSEAEWRKILRWNTDGIQTDHPQQLIEFLKAQKTESPRSRGRLSTR